MTSPYRTSEPPSFKAATKPLRKLVPCPYCDSDSVGDYAIRVRMCLGLWCGQDGEHAHASCRSCGAKWVCGPMEEL